MIEFEAINNNLTIYVMFLLLAISVYLYANNKDIIKHKFRMLTSTFEAEHDFKAIEGKNNREELALLLLFAFCMSLIFWRLANYYIIDDLSFVSVSAIVITCLGIKSVFLKLLGFLTNQSFVFGFYKYNIFLIYKLLAIISVPVIIMSYLSRGNIQLLCNLLLVVLLLFSVFIRLVKLFQLANKYYKFQKMYFFIYFCSLEILPNWLIIKLIF